MLIIVNCISDKIDILIDKNTDLKLSLQDASEQPGEGYDKGLFL